jgi:alpha-ribazole phosphatase
MELYLIRHPRPKVEEGVCYGQTDLPLENPAHLCAQMLRPLLPNRYRLFSSPLRRALECAKALGAPVVDPRLMEMDFGQWEGRRFDDIGEAALTAWANAPLDFAPPSGESPRQMAQRVEAWMDDNLYRTEGHEPLVLVAHGGPLRVIAGRLLHIPPEKGLCLDFQMGQVSRLDIESWGAVLRWMNRESVFSVDWKPGHRNP